MRNQKPPAIDPDAGWLTVVMRLAFLLLLGTSLLRYLTHHLYSALTPWVIALSAVLALVHLLGHAERRPVWLAGLLGTWVVLVLMAPSFAWCAVPLIYTVLRALPARAAIPLVTALTALVVVAEMRLADRFDPTLPLLPPAVAALATAVFLYMERQGARQRALIVDLISTRRELAATGRREGALAERERLAVEIHDTLAQGLSSQQMLLQAADRTWDQEPTTARAHVRTAHAIAARNLAEARRFVHDLAPADLAELGTLDAALQALADREAAESGLPVRYLVDGDPVPMSATAQAALLRIAQGALANVREHAGASSAVISLAYLGDQAVLDIADDGSGFAPAATPAAGTAPADPTTGQAPAPTHDTASARPGRGHGLPAMRARLRQLGGTLTVESVPGEGTVVSAAVPLNGPNSAAGDARPSTTATGPGRPTDPARPSGTGSARPTAPTTGSGRRAPDGDTPRAADDGRIPTDRADSPPVAAPATLAADRPAEPSADLPGDGPAGSGKSNPNADQPPSTSGAANSAPVSAGTRAGITGHTTGVDRSSGSISTSAGFGSTSMTIVEERR